MSVLEVVIYVLAGFCLTVGLLLSNTSSTGGLGVLAGQDLEIFKNTKDRGVVKILQVVMFLLMFLLVLCAVIYRVTSQAR